MTSLSPVASAGSSSPAGAARTSGGARRHVFRYRGVRYRADVGFEMRCDDCAARHDGSPWYWPITTEFWHETRGMVRCRACWSLYDRKKEQQRRARDPELTRARDRARYRRNRDVVRIKRRVYYEEHRDRILSRSRAYYEENRERLLEANRRYKAQRKAA